MPPKSRQEKRGGYDSLGLDKVIAGIVLAVGLLGIGAWGAIGELRHQVTHWGAIEIVDESRQALSQTIRQMGPHPDPQGREAILASFDDLSHAIDDLRDTERGDQFSDTAAGIAQRARIGFSVASAESDAAAAALRNLERDVDHLAEIAGAEAEEARRTLTLSTTAAERLEKDQRATSERLNALFGALVAAEQVRRQFEAFTRFNSSPAGQQSPLQGIRVSADNLPPTCTEDPQNDTSLVCKPSSERLRQAVAAIMEAPPEDPQQAARNGVLAAEAYVRAAEIRYHQLTADLRQSLDAIAGERQRAASLRQREIAISRVNRSITDIRALIKELPLSALDRIGGLDAQLRGHAAQVRMRLPSVIAAHEIDARGKAEIGALMDRIDGDWAVAVDATRAGILGRKEFEAALNGLGMMIMQTTGDVRAAAGRWIGVFSSSTVSVLGLLAFLVVGTAVMLRRHVTRPLAVVTGAILDLAHGKMNTPLVLRSGGAGFRKLAEATEVLRRANIERRDLLSRNAKQKLQIEQQMAELERTAREIEHQARHDALTGLGNRRFADDFLPELQAEAWSGERDYALLHVDVDRFKEINDTIGHDAGDFILKRMAEVLTAQTGPEDHTFRIGGDEFLVVLTDASDRDRVEAIAAAMVSEMSEPVDFDGHSCRVGGSIGIAFGREAGFDCRATLVNADMALYRAKNEGRNRYAFFSKDLQRQMVRTKKLSDDIFQALERSEFVPFYQPQFYSGSLALRGVEMLVRWQHPDLGLIGPAAFLDTAQDLKLIGQIDRLLFDKAAEDLRTLKARGIRIPKISFNVTADRLLHQDLAATLRASIDPDVQISLELLESMSLDTVSEALRWSIDSLKESDIRVEIDDFGSCRASIAGLIAVGPDAMKIDKAIVAPITRSDPHLRLTRAIVDIGQTLGIEVVAEGVETDAHVDLLNRIGCTVLQGFALGMPMSRDDLAEFLAERSSRPEHAA